MSSIPEVVLAGAADPEDAAHRAEAVVDAISAAGHDPAQLSDAALTILALSAQRAPYLARLLSRDPGRLARVAADPHLHRAKPAAAIAGELGQRLAAVPTDEPDAFDRALRRFRADEMVRLGVRELELGNRADVGAELSHLADACFDAAIGFHRAALSARYGEPRCRDADGADRACGLVVIGMGKLGGEELNFASDVDVIYVYSSDNGAAGELSLHEYFCKLAERVTQSIGRYTAEDVVFKVDLRLRPEGSRGAIANSLQQAEHYYETWGRAWERQAWLKARPCAGDGMLGAEVIQMMRPFVYPRSTSPAIIDDVTELNRRIKAELVGGVSVEAGFDVKNGVGGIREIEFFVQAHQLIHGGHRPTLRSRNTLVALDQLLFAGLVSEAEHQDLAQAYRYLRHTEHLLQLDSGRQTQRLPDDANELERFAHRLGHASVAELEQVLESHTARVAELFATLGGDGGVPPEVTALLSHDVDPARERVLLEQLGFAEPERSQQALERARRLPMSPFHGAARGAAARVAPSLLAEVCTSPDPDQALAHLIDLIGRRGAFSSLWGLFESSPMLTRLIASLFGTSEYLSKSFVAQPELIDELLQTGRASPRASLTELRARLAERSAGVDADDLEARWSRLAELKQAEVLRIGLSDIGGDLGVDAVSQELSLLAEVVLDGAFTIVADAMCTRHGVPRTADGEPAELAILAMGKLGARELGYASDLDLIFVYDGDGESDGTRPLDNVTYLTRLAQRLMSGLHTMHPGGRLYEVDTRLRPSGSKGLLVSSLPGWLRYHQGEARLWERQALIKLRAVAGDRALGQRVATAAARYAYGRAPGQDGSETAEEIAAGVADMRDRIERELAAGATLDLKAGRGGIVDVEFAAQYLQMLWGHDHEHLRCQGTVPALDAAAELGVLPPTDRELLVDGYRLLRRIENRMRIVHDRSVHRLPVRGRDLDLLARRAGYPDGAALERDCSRWMEALRGAYTRVLGQ